MTITNHLHPGALARMDECSSPGTGREIARYLSDGGASLRWADEGVRLYVGWFGGKGTRNFPLSFSAVIPLH